MEWGMHEMVVAWEANLQKKLACLCHCSSATWFHTLVTSPVSPPGICCFHPTLYFQNKIKMKHGFACPLIQNQVGKFATRFGLWNLVGSCFVGCGYWWVSFHYKAPLSCITPFSSSCVSTQMGTAADSQFHVLAVDDSLIDRKLIERLLKTFSYQGTV